MKTRQMFSIFNVELFNVELNINTVWEFIILIGRSNVLVLLMQESNKGTQIPEGNDNKGGGGSGLGRGHQKS